MGTIAARYDRSALAYEAWWMPVLRTSALAVLDLLDGARPPARILDVGAGTGTLALEAIRRFPAARVTALDGSRAMLDVGAGTAARLPAHDRDRLDFVDGLAERIPADDGAFDAAVSSFVLQLVPHRPRTLGELRRVLAPGGTLAFVTWVAGAGCADRGGRFAPDEVFYDVLDDLDIADDLEPEESRSGDYESAEAAVRQVRRAGYRDVTAREALLVHRHDPARYVDFLAEYAERDTFEALGDEQAAAVRRLTAERLARLDPEAFVWQAPLVYVRGTRPRR